MSSPIDLLLKRRSVVVKNMQPPGPTADELNIILRAGMRVPDHGKLTPWRFITLIGQARQQLSTICCQVACADNPQLSPTLQALEKNRLMRAPTVVVVVFSPVEPHKIPQWEQQLSCGAVCQNLLVAATAMGYASQWLTEWIAYHPEIHKALNIKEHEQIAGFIYFGSVAEPPSDRIRPHHEDLVSAWQPAPSSS